MGKKGRPENILGVKSILMYNILQCLEIAKEKSAREVLRDFEKEIGKPQHLSPIKGVLARAHESGLATKSWENYRLTPAGIDQVLSDRLRILAALVVAYVDDEKPFTAATLEELDKIVHELKQTVSLIHRKPERVPNENLGVLAKFETYWRKIPKDFYEHYAEEVSLHPELGDEGQVGSP
jgi:hypothetical protein